MATPRDVVCPACGAKVNHGCHSRYQAYYSTRTHRMRWLAIGAPWPPTDAQRLADSTDGEERDAKFRMEFFKNLREVAAIAKAEGKP